MGTKYAESLHDGDLFLGFNGHIYQKRSGKPDKDLGRLFEVLLKVTAQINLSCRTKRGDPRYLQRLCCIQYAIRKKAAYMERLIYSRISGLATFLVLYISDDPRLKAKDFLLSLAQDKVLANLLGLPKLKPILSRIEKLANEIEAKPETEVKPVMKRIAVKQEVCQIIGALEHLVNP
ncbi:MAG: hypothetical protein NTX26_03530 [Candidatus Parcubacteria bacterium]|nr:hypothetical protein [Candidatus Parcubacteria bacterium]